MKKITALLLGFTATSCILATGCGKVDSNVSGNYVAAILDASYKNQSKNYIAMTESTEEEANEIYNSTVKYFTEYITYYCEVSSEDISDDLNAEFTSAAAELLYKSKYTVASSENGKESCYVKVSIKPLDILSQLEPDIEACIEEYNLELEALGEEGLENLTDEQYTELEEDYARNVLEALKKCAAEPEYKDNVDFTIEIEIDDDGYYAPANENDWNTIDDYVMGLY